MAQDQPPKTALFGGGKGPGLRAASAAANKTEAAGGEPGLRAAKRAAGACTNAARQNRAFWRRKRTRAPRANAPQAAPAPTPAGLGAPAKTTLFAGGNKAPAPRGSCRANQTRSRPLLKNACAGTLELSRAESLLECPQLFFDPGRYPGFRCAAIVWWMQGSGRLFATVMRSARASSCNTSSSTTRFTNRC